MEFGLSEEQTLLQDSVNRFLGDQVPLDRVRKFVANGGGEDIWQGLIELGIPGLIIPESCGGVGLGCLDAAIVSECLGYHVTPAPFLGSVVMAPIALLESGKQEDLLRGIAAGDSTVGVAFGEAVGARADAGSEWDGAKLNGKALFVIDYLADYVLVATSDKKILLVSSDAKGLGKRALTTVERTRHTGELVFEDTPAELISEDPSVYLKVLDAGRVMLAADTLGAAQNMLDQSVAYAKVREQFNRPIGSFQAVKHMCAQMVADLEPCRAMIWYAGHALDHIPDEARLTACHTKAHLSEVGRSVSKTATEVHGGMGFTDLLGLHYWFKRIGFNRQMLGAPEMVREEAAQVQDLC
jgi:alkylation response protein AidB-like acyl-CoA dehydrogenase|tara:strand:- start:2634 stop:3695 length:1062 start_codon:yes stop_codon:yes gene_type:complete